MRSNPYANLTCDQRIVVYMPARLVDDVDVVATKARRSRGEWIRLLVEAELERLRGERVEGVA